MNDGKAVAFSPRAMVHFHNNSTQWQYSKEPVVAAHTSYIVPKGSPLVVSQMTLGRSN